ncbi:MAG: HAMP domain-containing protein [Planctomycetaceae bacterium]|nr:HAMP domain-containing protein [Planctomycetaceae bacterium]
MSYRSVKRILGETSLERKCRFLLGAGMLILIASSFWFYSYLNSELIYEQNLRLARTMVGQDLAHKHWVWAQNDQAEKSEQTPELLWTETRPESLKEAEINVISASSNPAETANYLRAFGEKHYQVLEHLKRKQLKFVERGIEEIPEFVEYNEDDDLFRYHQAVTIKESCRQCHHHKGSKVGEMIAMSSMEVPLGVMDADLELQRAFLIATALVTAFLAMLGAYAIVRYVIVKPVLHLKDVSDEIARGNLDLRADIRTGDEFEELSHAFNRMLRHLVTVQDELKNVNNDLDGKVDELAHVNLQLYEMNNLKDEFLATMSHELRTPLNSILGFSDVLAEAENLEDKQRRYVSNIQSSGKHLMSLINDILDLAKIESGKMDLQLVQFELAEFIDRQVGTMQPLADRKNIELTHNVDPSLEEVFQDRGKLQQILNNLLSNALKFTPEGGRVSVRAVPYQDDLMEITVTDTGVGIRLEDQEQVFEKFRQGKSIPGQQNAITREHGGTGLGLSIVKELSRLLGGETFLESEFGKGSTFGIRIPIHHAPDLGETFSDPLARYAGINRLHSATDKSIDSDTAQPSSVFSGKGSIVEAPEDSD